MATALSLDHLELTRARSKESQRSEIVRLYAEKMEREGAEHLQLLGMSAQECAAAMSEPGRTIEECVAAGLMSAPESRFLEGRATREDLTELGYSAEEVARILEEQAGACESSG
ncbi:MAG: hypothetical protein R3B70_00950 [Polyangiaceae bacterium]